MSTISNHSGAGAYSGFLQIPGDQPDDESSSSSSDGGWEEQTVLSRNGLPLMSPPEGPYPSEDVEDRDVSAGAEAGSSNGAPYVPPPELAPSRSAWQAIGHVFNRGAGKKFRQAVRQYKVKTVRSHGLDKTTPKDLRRVGKAISLLNDEELQALSKTQVQRLRDRQIRSMTAEQRFLLVSRMSQRQLHARFQVANRTTRVNIVDRMTKAQKKTFFGGLHCKELYSTRGRRMNYANLSHGARADWRVLVVGLDVLRAKCPGNQNVALLGLHRWRQTGALWVAYQASIDSYANAIRNSDYSTAQALFRIGRQAEKGDRILSRLRGSNHHQQLAMYKLQLENEELRRDASRARTQRNAAGVGAVLLLAAAA